MSAVETAIDTSGQNVIFVHTAEDLAAALEQATGGEIIALAPGDYGSLDLNDARAPYVHYADTVTITSADPENPASFSNVSLRGVENLQFDTVVFDYAFEPGDPNHLKPFSIEDSSNIAIRNSVFDGDVAHGNGPAEDGYGTAIGLFVTNSDGVTVDNNEFFEFHRGAVFDYSENLKVLNNDVHAMSSDGFNFAAVSDVLIEGNTLHDFAKPPESDAHKDMIQFWTSGTSQPSTDIIIRGNFLYIGEGDPTQSIFMRNGLVDMGLAGEEMFYRDVLIEHNVIYNAHTHGITVGETDGLIIRNNTILEHKETDDEVLVSVPTINVSADAKNVHVTDNIVPRLSEPENADHEYENNLIVQSEYLENPNYVGDLFVDAYAGSDVDLASLQAIPDTIAEDVGSYLTTFDTAPDEITGYISNEVGTGLYGLSVAFDASRGFDSDGKLDMSGANVTWDFGDGYSARGAQTSHVFKTGGSHDVTATVELASGETLILHKTIELASPIALNVTADSGLQDLSDDANSLSASPDVDLEPVGDGKAIRLNGGAVTVDATSDFIGNSEYTFAFDLKTDAYTEERAHLVNFSNSFVVFVEGDTLSVAVTTDAGDFWMHAEAAGIQNGDWHTVALTFSSETGKAELYLDGQSIAVQTGLEGQIQVGDPSADLIIGNPHNQSAYEGLIDNVLFLRGAADAKDVGSHQSLLEAVVAQANEPVNELKTWLTEISSAVAAGAVADDEQVKSVYAIESADQAQGLIQPPLNEPEDEYRKIIDSADAQAHTEDCFLCLVPNDKVFVTYGDENDSDKGSDGDDYVELGAGDDYYNGVAGDDVVFGGAGNDTILGFGGFDRVNGGAGDDHIQANLADGGAGHDRLIGEDDYQDRLFGGAGNDRLEGRGEDDSLFGGDGDDTLSGGDGNDQLFGDSGNDILRSGAGDDGLFGGDGDDTLAGYEGDDYFDGGQGRDTLVGGAGNDTFLFDTDDKEIIGNGGYDTLRIDNAEQNEHSLSSVRLNGVDALDINNGYADLVSFSHRDLRRTDAKEFTIEGNQGDVLIIDAELSVDGKFDFNDESYVVLTSRLFSDEIKIYVDEDISVIDGNDDIVYDADGFDSLSG